MTRWYKKWLSYLIGFIREGCRCEIVLTRKGKMKPKIS